MDCGRVRGMGFSSPKTVKPAVAPPPVTTTGADVAFAANETRINQQRRQGYVTTIGQGTLLPAVTETGTGNKTLLGAN